MFGAFVQKQIIDGSFNYRAEHRKRSINKEFLCESEYYTLFCSERDTDKTRMVKRGCEK